MGLKLTTPPATEPVTLTEAKAQCRVEEDFLADDALLLSLITATRRFVEQHTGVGFVEQTWELTLRAFPRCGEPIVLPRGPVLTIESITYLNTAGATQTLDPGTYVHEASELTDQLSLAYGQAWPTVRSQADAIAITFTVGYKDPTSGDPAVPEEAKRLMLQRVADLYRNREAQLVGGGGLSSQGNSAYLEALNALVREVAF